MSLERKFPLRERGSPSKRELESLLSRETFYAARKTLFLSSREITFEILLKEITPSLERFFSQMRESSRSFSLRRSSRERDLFFIYRESGRETFLLSEREIEESFLSREIFSRERELSVRRSRSVL